MIRLIEEKRENGWLKKKKYKYCEDVQGCDKGNNNVR